MHLFWLIDKGLCCFHSLIEEYCITPSGEYDMCTTDLPFFKKMHTQPQNLVLASIFSAYAFHYADSSMDLVSEELLNLEVQNSAKRLYED